MTNVHDPFRYLSDDELLRKTAEARRNAHEAPKNELDLPYWEELKRLRSDNARLRAAWDDVGIGGNHLANFLIHRLGGDFASHYAPSDKSVPAALGKIDPEALDVWYCWAALMRARAALASHRITSE